MSASEEDSGKKKSFLCGVCEGFYGKPWSQDQRKELFHRMERMGLNTYLYAPKDDYKHRLNWRDLYCQQEQDDLRELITAAKDSGVTFVYALSPGLDITFSSKEDVDILKRKLKQVQSFGCEAFALLFDDIDTDLSSDDEATFDTSADAQSVVTNVVYKHLGQPQTFLFCPTEYCATRAVPDLARSEYLEILGEQLHKNIGILWTGPKVVSQVLSVESINDVSLRIQRPPVIWDNLHANDYDQTRLFLGPYDGRPPELVNCLGGVLTNPNCEFEANFIAMHTLAQWQLNTVQNFPDKKKGSQGSDVDMEESKATSSITTYQPNKALVRAVQDWIPEFYKNSETHKCNTKSQRESPSKDDATMDTGEGDTTKAVSAASKSAKDKTKEAKQKMNELEPLDTQDVLLICDAFYLPYEYGSQAVDLLKRAHWLVDNVDRLKDIPKPMQTDLNDQEKEWYEKAVSFHERHKEVVLIVDKFVNMTNRDILYQLYDYVNDMRSVLSLVNSYVKWNGIGRPDKEPFRNGDPEPWVHRGGLHAEFRRLLPLEGTSDMFQRPSNTLQNTKVYTIRPFFPADKPDVFDVCRRTCDDGLDGSDIFKELQDLPGDSSIGALLEFYPSFCFVLEDNAGLCGYVAACPDAKEYQEKCVVQWLPNMRKKYPKVKSDSSAALTIKEETVRLLHSDPRAMPSDFLEKFPSYLQLAIAHKCLTDVATAKSLLACAIKTLKAHGSKGVYTSVHLSHFRNITYRCKIGFDELIEERKPLDDMNVLLIKPI